VITQRVHYILLLGEFLEMAGRRPEARSHYSNLCLEEHHLDDYYRVVAALRWVGLGAVQPNLKPSAELLSRSRNWQINKRPVGILIETLYNLLNSQRTVQQSLKCIDLVWRLQQLLPQLDEKRFDKDYWQLSRILQILSEIDSGNHFAIILYEIFIGDEALSKLASARDTWNLLSLFVDFSFTQSNDQGLYNKVFETIDATKRFYEARLSEGSNTEQHKLVADFQKLLQYRQLLQDWLVPLRLADTPSQIEAAAEVILDLLKRKPCLSMALLRKSTLKLVELLGFSDSNYGLAARHLIAICLVDLSQGVELIHAETDVENQHKIGLELIFSCLRQNKRELAAQFLKITKQDSIIEAIVQEPGLNGVTLQTIKAGFDSLLKKYNQAELIYPQLFQPLEQAERDLEDTSLRSPYLRSLLFSEVFPDVVTELVKKYNKNRPVSFVDRELLTYLTIHISRLIDNQDYPQLEALVKFLEQLNQDIVPGELQLIKLIQSAVKELSKSNS
jgi:hypothetical protein